MTSKNTITVHNKDNLKTVAIKDLKPLQGNLKNLTEENYQKLKNSILKFGFFVPIFMWNDYILDGHGRQRVMIKEGWGDTKVPIVNIEAENELEAREKLLHITSQYQTITIEGLEEFYPDWQDLDTHFDIIKFDKKVEKNVDKELELKETKELVIDFAQSDKSIEELFNELINRGYKCKILIS